MEGGRNSSEGSAVAGRRASEDEAESESESETEVAEEDWKIGGDDGGSAKGGGEDRAGRRRPRDARSPAPSSSSSSQSSSPPPSVDAADLSLDERAVGRCDDDVEEDDDDSEDPASVASDHPSDYYRDDDDDGGSSGDETSSASSVRSADRSPLSSSGEGSAEEEGGDDGPLRPSSPDAAGSPAPVDGFERDSPSPDEDDAAAAFDDDDDSLGFPPGYSTRRSELSSLQNHDDGPLRRGSSDLFLLPAHRRRGSSLRSSLSSASSSVNPSVIPSYFFCPLSHSIMKDPVLTPYGNTYDRRSILRWLILAKTDPLSKGALDAGDLKDDRLVRRAIERARREAWVRIVGLPSRARETSLSVLSTGGGTVALGVLGRNHMTKIKTRDFARGANGVRPANADGGRSGEPLSPESTNERREFDGRRRGVRTPAAPKHRSGRARRLAPFARREPPSNETATESGWTKPRNRVEAGGRRRGRVGRRGGEMPSSAFRSVLRGDASETPSDVSPAAHRYLGFLRPRDGTANARIRRADSTYVVELEEREGVSIEAEGEGNGTPRGSGLYEDEEDMSFDDEGDL
ncbi:hypothetical protein ACHAWF_011461 [Thalassiosira exigua]